MRCRVAPVPALCAVALTVVLMGCGGGSKGASPTKRTVPPASVHLVAGPVTIRATGGDGSLPDTDRDAIVATTARYVDGATLSPLNGKRASTLGTLFTAATAGRLDGPDRAVLTDDGLPRRTGRVTITAQPVALTALTDGAGHPTVVAAAVDVTVTAPTARGTVTVKRVGELAFVNDGGAWKIESYRFLVTRDGAGLNTTTSSSGGTR